MNALRAQLPHAYPVFFGRFPKLTPVQEQSVPLIMKGGDVLISAPTASGKTEAFAAPAGEMVRVAKSNVLQVLIISPTRALANDLYRRLSSRFEDLGVSFGRYTGEHKDRVAGRIPQVVIATPEALDSLLARRPERLCGIRLVVMDEIHILDGSTRGDQLRILLHRLSKTATHPIQRIAVSATVEGPTELARRYLKDAAIVAIPGDRPILIRAFDGGTPLDLSRHCDTLAAHDLRKILIFCNRRADVEAVTRGLRKGGRFREHIYPHHASLSQSVRERTEERFLAAPAAVAVATMTLEIGIDIGSVDYVLLAGLPSSVSALLQRIGRGNRRTGKTRAGYTVDRAQDEILASHMFRAARAGRLLGRRYAFRPSVIAQQALVIAAAENWVDARRLRNAVPPEIWEEAEPADPREILDALVLHGHLEASGGHRYVMSDEIEQRYLRGHLHSNLADDPGLDVVDRLTGEILGKLEATEEREIQLGGHGRRIVGITDTSVLTDAAGREVMPHFTPKGIPLTSLALARDVVRSVPRKAKSKPLGDADIPTFRVGGSLIVLHGLGTLGNRLLVHLIEETIGSIVTHSSAFGMSITKEDFALPPPPPDQFAKLITHKAMRLEKFCQPGPWHSSLPKAVRIASLHSQSGAEEVSELLSRARLVPVELTAADREAWADLVAGAWATARAPVAP